MAIPFQVTFDCADPDALSVFWAAALGYTLQDPPEGYASWEDFLRAQGIPKTQWNKASAIVDPDGAGSRVFFQQVPEPKTVKNRVHLDLNVSQTRSVGREEGHKRLDAEMERLVGLGATRVRACDEDGETWIVMADPEGNEFCIQ